MLVGVKVVAREFGVVARCLLFAFVVVGAVGCLLLVICRYSCCCFMGVVVVSVVVVLWLLLMFLWKSHETAHLYSTTSSTPFARARS